MSLDAADLLLHDPQTLDHLPLVLLALGHLGLHLVQLLLVLVLLGLRDSQLTGLIINHALLTLVLGL